MAGSAPSGAAVRPDTGREPAHVDDQLWAPSYPGQASPYPAGPTGVPGGSTVAVSALTPGQPPAAGGGVITPRLMAAEPASAQAQGGGSAPAPPASVAGRTAVASSPAPAAPAQAKSTPAAASTPKPTPTPTQQAAPRQNSCPSLLGLLRLCLNVSLG
ncbi:MULTISPECIES: hypothetical protein [Protofrankia]|uniref:hypothetical protein n=1 Tax=Protofrankia TaxID=2994361 RepID=UPI0005BAE46F|nr:MULTISPECIES: hypothetical protein [Protofrankia]